MKQAITEDVLQKRLLQNHLFCKTKITENIVLKCMQERLLLEKYSLQILKIEKNWYLVLCDS